MAIITKVPAITTALAIHGFMAQHRPLFVLRRQSHQGVCPANVRRQPPQQADGCMPC